MENNEKQLVPKYDDETKKYISDVKKRLELARDLRNKPHSEFDGMTYVQYHESNEKGANTYIEPKKSKYDNNFQSGTIRSKLMTLLSSISNLNLSPDISAFDTDDVEINRLGNAMEQIIFKTEELEGDEEKKILRQYELLKQGTVFVEEVWKEQYKMVNTSKKKFDGKLEGEWNKKLKKCLPQPERNIISGLGVYLGDIRQYDIEKQPYIFTVEVMPYENAKKIFGKWDRWKYVPKKLVKDTQGDQNTLYGWNITEVEDNNVEIIKYQDKPNNEYAIFINGILMTPKGLPFQWGWEGYNITQQNLEPITQTFAYGKSLVARLKANTAILDEMLRLAVLKTQKSFTPPYFNMSGRVLSSKIFMPGVITKGISTNQVMPANAHETTGVTTPELMMIDKLQQTNDFNSVSPSFQGQQTNGEQTATEVLTVQKQAKAAIGLMVNMCSLLEWKLSWLRLFNILENWFNPIDQVVDETRTALRNKYRIVNRETPIEGEGIGRTMVIPDDEVHPAQEIYDEEENIKKRTGTPTRIIYVNPKIVKSSKLVWQVVVRPREKMTSELGKLMTERFIQMAMTFPNANYDELAKIFAESWEKNPAKLFNRGTAAPQEPTPQGSQKGVPELSNVIQTPKQRIE